MNKKTIGRSYSIKMPNNKNKIISGNKQWLDLQKKHFDKEASSYSLMYGVDTPFQSVITQRFLDFARVRANQNVLDIGCGFGRTTIPLLKAGCRVTGLDISKPTLEALGKKIRKMRLGKRFMPLLLPAEEIPFQKKFHLIIGRGILHHLKDPAPVLSKVYKALLPGGRAVFMDPNPLQPAWILFTTFHPTLLWSVEKHTLRGTPSKSCSMLKAAGFIKTKHAFLGIVPPPLLGKIRFCSKLEKSMTSIPGLRMLALYITVSGEKPSKQ